MIECIKLSEKCKDSKVYYESYNVLSEEEQKKSIESNDELNLISKNKERKEEEKKINLEKRNKLIKTDYEVNNISTTEIAFKYDLSKRMIELLAKEGSWKRSGKVVKKSSIVEKCSKTNEWFDTDTYVFVYLVDFEEHGVYIGSTKNIPQRFRVHIADAKNGKHSSRIINNLAKDNLEYVIEKFNRPTILYTNLKGSKEEMLTIEREFQIKYIDEGYRVLGGIY